MNPRHLRPANDYGAPGTDPESLSNTADLGRLVERRRELLESRMVLRAALLQDFVTAPCDDPEIETKRILDCIEKGLPATNKSELRARLVQTTRDVEILNVAIGKAENRLRLSRTAASRERARGADVVRALQAVGVAAQRLIAANAAARELAASLAAEGWAEFVYWGQSGPMYFGAVSAESLEDWRSVAEALCGASVRG
jgi:hypothetical protein